VSLSIPLDDCGNIVRRILFATSLAKVSRWDVSDALAAVLPVFLSLNATCPVINIGKTSERVSIACSFDNAHLLRAPEVVTLILGTMSRDLRYNHPMRLPLA